MTTDTDLAAHWDAIVVGSGIGGLVTAAYLVTSGLRVLVLEQHDVAGGNAHVFRRRRAYEFDVGVHYVGDCGPGGLLPSILSGVGLAGRVRFAPLDQDGFDRIVLPGVTLDVPTGWDRYGARLREALPADVPGIDRYLDICTTLAQACRAALVTEPGAEQRMPAVALRWRRRTLATLFDHCGLSGQARTVLAAQSGNYASAPASTMVVAHAMMVDEYLRGAYYPEGGGQMIPAALVELLESHGGTLLTRSTVRRIVVEDGSATGVELDDGTRLHAPVVVSNADYLRTVTELCAGALPPDLEQRTASARMRLPMAVCYVALDRELPDLPNANIWYWPTEDVEKAYGRLEAGELDEPPFAFLSFSSTKDPIPGAACPPGHTNFQIMTACPRGYEPWGLAAGPADGTKYRRDSGYLAAKHRLTEQLLDLAEAAIGPFRDHIVHLETATPLSQERYTLSTGGTPYGLESWGRPGQRPDVHTGVTGLYAVGQSTQYGAGISGVAIGGVMCASAILGRAVLPEVLRGAVFGDPSLLPPRPADWDPLRISRGARRRDDRGFTSLRHPPRR